jgi:hypothetical protein
MLDAAYWPIFFQKLQTNLRPGGIAVLQAITIDERRFADYRRRPDFIQTYIFPGGMLPTSRIVETQIRRPACSWFTRNFLVIAMRALLRTGSTALSALGRRLLDWDLICGSGGCGNII